MNFKISNIKNFKFYKYLPYFFGLFFIFSLHIYFIVENKSALIFYGDSFEQELMFYLGGWERFNSSGFNFWDWSSGFGANSFSNVFYFLSSPFFYLSLLFEKNVVPYLFLYINLFKLFLLFSFSYLWLSGNNQNQMRTSLIGAFILTFSGWVLFYYHYNFFLDAFLIYSLILYFIDQFILDKRKFLYTFMIAILGIVNFYFLYMFIPFIGLYSIFKLYLKGDTFTKSCKQLISLIFFSLLGLALSSLILLPSISIILQTPRLQDITQLDLFSIIGRFDVYRFFSSLYSPVMKRLDPTFYMSTEVYQGLGWGGGVSLYTSLMFPLLIPFVFKLEKRLKVGIIIFYGILLFLSIFLVFYRLLQGTVDVRWYYMFVLMNVFVVTKILSNLSILKISRKEIVLSTLFTVLTIIILYSFSYVKGYYGSELNLKVLTVNMIYSLLIVSVYGYILTWEKTKIAYVFVVVLIEVSVSFYIPLIQNPPIEESELAGYVQTINDRSVVDYIESKDKDFYRILKDNENYLTQNEPFAQAYASMSFYSSVYNYSLDRYYDRFNETYSIPNTYGRDDTYLFSSFKYYVTKSGQHSEPFGFVKLGTYKEFDIYINEYFVPLIYTQKSTLNQSVFESKSYLEQDALLLNYVVTEESNQKTTIDTNELINYATQVHAQRYYLPLPETSQAMKIIIENPYINNIKIRFLKDGKFIREESFYQYFYISKYINPDEGITEVEILLPQEDSSDSGYNIYLDLDLSNYDTWYQNLKPGFSTNLMVGDDQISAEVNSLSNQTWVVTSIPYDKGWSLKVDQKTVEIKNVDMGFIGFMVNEGTHQIELKYETPYLKLGIFISLGTLICIILSRIIFKFKSLTSK